MSSHREAPQISKDPVADSTDVYAFVSPWAPSTVTLIANYIPLQLADGGPNFYEFGDDVLYEIHVDQTGDGTPDVSFQFQFTTTTVDPSTFLYNTGPITSLTDSTWNRKQSYTLTRVDHASGATTTLGSGLLCPPCNIGRLSTPDYHALGAAAVHRFSAGGYSGQVFAGQRQEGFYVDLGAVFDLGILRPFEQDHNMFGLKNTGLGRMAAGINSTHFLNVHSLALEVPIEQVTKSGGRPSSVGASDAVIGVWTTASRRASIVNIAGQGKPTETGAYVQVSRLGNPLVNEVLIGLGDKDTWNHLPPSSDKQFLSYFSNPGLAQLLPTLYPGVFPNLAKYNAGKPDRADLVAILLTGLPSGVVPGFQNELAASGVYADELRLNLAVPPAKKPSNLGLVGGDAAGFPNGRRVFDDVATIELRALAGATLPLVDKSYKADAAAGEVSFGLTDGPSDLRAKGTEYYNDGFPVLGMPLSGFEVGPISRVVGH